MALVQITKNQIKDGAITLSKLSQEVLDYIQEIAGNGGNGDMARWTTWDATRESDSVITSSVVLAKGIPVRYKATGGSWNYGLVVGIDGEDHSINGIPVDVDWSDVFEYGLPEMVNQVSFYVPGNCIVASPFTVAPFWQKATGFCVRTTWIVETAPSGASIFGNFISGSDEIHNNDIELSGSLEVNSGVNILPETYQISMGEPLYFTLTGVGSTVPGAGFHGSVAIIVP